MSLDSDLSSDPVRVLTASNGVELHLVSTPAPRSSLCLMWIESPLSWEQGGDREAHALLPDLLTRGTGRAPGLAQMAARCEQLYGADLLAAVSACGANQILRLGVEVLADRCADGRPLFREAVELLAESLYDPPLVGQRFRPDHLAQERDNLVRSIEGLRDDRGLLAYRRLIELMHAGRPQALHSWGDASSARRLDEARVHAAWDHIRSEAAVRLAVVGDIDEGQALWAAELLGGDGRRRAPSEPPVLPAPRGGPPRHASEALPLSQSQLVLGFSIEPSVLAGPAAPLLAMVLGGGSHSRLFKAVRERAGLAYGCSASLLVDSASLVVQAGIDADQAEHVTDMVRHELSSLAAGRLSTEELHVSRDALLARLDAVHDAPRDLMAWRLMALASGRESRLEAAQAALARVLPADVCRVARGVQLDSSFLLEGTGP